MFERAHSQSDGHSDYVQTSLVFKPYWCSNLTGILTLLGRMLAQQTFDINMRKNMTAKLIEICRKNLILFGAFNIIFGLLIGFALGIYTLPILTAEKGLNEAEIAGLKVSVKRSGSFVRDLEGSDIFHWGEGVIMVSDEMVWLDGEVSPGPAYRLYFAPAFVETKQDFLAIKDQSVEIGSVGALRNFSLPLPDGVVLDEYPAVVIWCETFSAFITAAALS